MNNDTKSPAPSTSVKPGVMYLEHPRGVLSIIDYEVCHGECHVCGTKWFTREVVRECPTCNPVPVAGEKREGIQLPPLDSPEGLVLPPFEFVHGDEAEPTICQLAALLGFKVDAVRKHVRVDDDSVRCMYAQIAVRALRRATEAEGRVKQLEKETERLKRVEEFVECTGRARAVMDRAEAAEAKLAEALAKIAALEEELKATYADIDMFKLIEGSVTLPPARDQEIAALEGK